MRTTITGLVLAAFVAAFVAACAGSSTGALGFASAPADLDPNSPKVAARDIDFDRTDVAVPAGRAFILVFENQESASHNVSIYRDAAFKDRIFEGVVFGGPATRWYPVPALTPGTYFFQCDIHPVPPMQGTITAGL
ncbi:MAG TPA: cupredoxin domain-containing protein [Candidatus Limnocylindrales bacterium]